MESISVEKESSCEDVEDEEDPGGFPPNWFSVSFANFPTEESLSLSEGGRRKTPLEPAKKEE